MQLAIEQLVDGLSLIVRIRSVSVKPAQKESKTEAPFLLVVVQELSIYLTLCTLMSVVSSIRGQKVVQNFLSHLLMTLYTKIQE